MQDACPVDPQSGGAGSKPPGKPPTANDPGFPNPDDSGDHGEDDDGDGAEDRPPGVPRDWVSRPAENGKGRVWQDPSAKGNENSMRIMDPTPRYPDGYVRFYNEYGQPLDLDGKPGPNSLTHIPRAPNGNYSIPKGWAR